MHLQMIMQRHDWFSQSVSLSVKSLIVVIRIRRGVPFYYLLANHYKDDIISNMYNSEENKILRFSKFGHSDLIV